MEQTIQQLLEEQKKTNEYLERLAYQQCTGKDPYEMLTREQVMKEFHVGLEKSLKMFQDPERPVQRYTKAHRVQRIEIIKYLSKSHDYLCEE